MNNPLTRNGSVQSYLNEEYSDALLSLAVCDVFEAETKYFKGNIVSSVVNNYYLLSQCIIDILRYVFNSMLRTFYCLNLASNFKNAVLHQNILVLSINLFLLSMISLKNSTVLV